ncbi:MAG TPA: hypothetical protein DCQ51_08460 [Planktothrix sp. UBA8407]|jgi:hypothetical protein|nr:hypothetical protein [Planktothrix sp. UBA8407]HBK23707.1 hypothetical protein [Planktothrix sp. UBA10369]
MSNLIAVLMISAVVGLPQSFNPQPQIIEQLDPEQIQSLIPTSVIVSQNSDQIKVVHHNNNDKAPSDIDPKPGDGRREN